MIVDDKYHLLALHRVIMQAKFDGDPSDTAIPFSPIVSGMANQIVDEIISALNQENNPQEAAAWNEWRLVEPGRKEYFLIEKRYRDNVAHDPSGEFDRDELLMVLSAPLRLSEVAKRAILEAARAPSGSLDDG
ncbi:hypothetical protein [Chitinimonas naiadis]